VVIDQTFNWPEIWQDILKRTYITVGMVCLIGLIPLAITSNNVMIRRLGGKTWRNLHKLVYVIVPLAGLHFFMMRKGIQIEPLVYGAVIMGLLVVRLIPRRKR
jgi:sulfoxide reductase heme-binding subunit YedZ